MLSLSPRSYYIYLFGYVQALIPHSLHVEFRGQLVEVGSHFPLCHGP